MNQRDNRIRVPSGTKNVRENNKQREAGPSLDRNLNILLFEVMHSGNLEASLAPGDEGSHKAPKIESFSLKQLFLDLSSVQFTIFSSLAKVIQFLMELLKR